LFALALMGLGIGGAWAETIEVKLGDIKYVTTGAERDRPYGTVEEAADPTHVAVIYKRGTGTTTGSDPDKYMGDTLAQWNGSTVAAVSVSAIARWRPTNQTTPGDKGTYYDTLYIYSAGSDKANTIIKITGTLPAAQKFVKIKFDGDAESVLWDGGTVVGGEGRATDVFLDVPAAVTGGLTIVSGSITSYAKSLIKNVGAAAAPINKIGSTAPAGNAITLISYGSEAAIQGAAIVINTPGSGKYTIKSDSTAIEATTSVQIGTNPTDVASGEVEIAAWEKGTSNSSAGAAIKAGTATAGASFIKVYGRGNKVSVSSKGKYVLWVPNSNLSTEAILVKDALINHTAPNNTAGGIVFNGGEGAASKVLIENSTVYGATTSAALLGQLVVSAGPVTINRGTYAAATGTSGNAITTKAKVTIQSAKITASAMSSTAKPDYVISTEGAVDVLAGTNSSDSAVVAWTGTSGAVGGIKAGGNVLVKANGNRKAEVRVGNGTTGGSGTAIYMYSNVGADATVVTIEGSANGSAVVKANTGHAILVPNETGAGSADVSLKDAVIARTGTPATGFEYLVKVTGGDIEVDGASLTSTAINVAATGTTSLGVGLFAAPTTNAAGTGNVYVFGGSIAGKTGAIEADAVEVGDGTRKSTDIRSTDGVTIKAKYDILIDNPAANITNTNGIFGNAVVQSTDGDIEVATAGTILGTTQATALLTTSTGNAAGFVTVNGGTVKSGTGPAIVASNAVTVDKNLGDVVVLVTSGSAGQTATNPWNATIYVDAARVPAGNASVTVGNATVEATGTSGNASAIRTINKGKVVVNDNKVSGNATYAGEPQGIVKSTSGNAIMSVGGDVDFVNGEVKAEAKTQIQNGVLAAIHVTDGGFVNVGVSGGAGSKATVTSEGVTLAVYSTGQTTCTVDIGEYGVIEVKGTVATAGAIRVTGYSIVNFGGSLNISAPGSKAFAIEAATGEVLVYGKARIKSEDGIAVTTTGAPINVTGGFVSGNAGVLFYAKKNTVTNRAGRVTVSGNGWAAAAGAGDLAISLANANGLLQDNSSFVKSGETLNKTCIYNKYGTAIKAEDTVAVYGRLLANAAGELVDRVVVATDADTAIVTGTASVPGVALLYGGHIWAAGAYDKTGGIAVASKKVFMYRFNGADGYGISRAGAVVEANTARTSIDNEEMYSNAKVTGILIRPATKGSGEGNLEIYSGKVIANGASLGINNTDTLVTVLIHGYVTPTTQYGPVVVQAGNNGTGIRSVGEIDITGETAITEDARVENKRLPNVAVYVGSGNGASAKAIVLPIETGAKKKELRLYQTFVEAGSDGAVAVEGAKNALLKLYRSVILVRHASTAVRGLGGVYVNAAYVEVLATENNNTGTAILGNEINISGGLRTNIEDKSEIHSKGIAVQDTIGGTPIEVTGVIHMSGTVATRMNIGSSVMGDTGTLTMGSEKSRNLWRLTAASDVTISREKGKALTIPAGVTVVVADNASKLETEKFDTVKVAGNITTVGKQAGAQFVNTGKVIIEKGGNISFNKSAASSLKNSNGIFVLKTGSLLDSIVIVHDSGTNIGGVQYTFLKLAKILSGDSVGTVGTRGPGKVIIPPLYAALYGNPRLFVDDDDMETATKDYWDANSARTDSVYTAKYVKYPVDKRYKKYINASESDTAKGNYTLSGIGTVRVEDDGTVLLTEAGTFQRVAVMENEAGIGTKTYTHNVSRVDYNRIKVGQTNGPIFFDGFVNNADGRVDIAKDTILVRQDGNVQVKYTGKIAKLIDGVKGAKTAYRDLDTDRDVYYDGLGVVTFWYSAAGSEMFLLSSNPPTTVGTYNVWASMSDAGRNFEQVPSGESKIVPIGQVKITAGDIGSIFDKNNGIYQIIVELEAKVARPRVTVQLPSVAKFGAKYDAENILVTGTARDALTSEPTISATTANDSTLTFGVDANTDFSQNIDMKVTLLNNAEPPNLLGGQSITVRVIFRTKEEMKELTPSYITVNYVDAKLSGLLAGTTYVINGTTQVVAVSDTTAILPAWIGDTISVQALKTTEFKFDSDVAKIYIGKKLQVNEALRAVTADSASTSQAADGRLAHTTTAMEYKLSTDIGWKPASAVATDGLKAGTYYIRLAPVMTAGTTPGAFASDSLTIKIFPKAVIAVAEGNREVPAGSTTTESAVAPVKIAAAAFTAGPSPASKASGEIAFFSTKAVKSGTLYIFDATGKTVAKVKASGAGKIGSWNLSTAAEGSYVVKGALVGKDGTKEKVSFVFSVVK